MYCVESLTNSVRKPIDISEALCYADRRLGSSHPTGTGRLVVMTEECFLSANRTCNDCVLHKAQYYIAVEIKIGVFQGYMPERSNSGFDSEPSIRFSTTGETTTRISPWGLAFFISHGSQRLIKGKIYVWRDDLAVDRF